jgi:hypothetical protein
MADPNEMLRRVRHGVALLQDAFSGGPGSYDRERIAEDVVASFDVLDAFLSSGGKPPTAWVEGPDEPSMDGDHWGWQSDKPAPEGFAVFAHWSQVHDGVNVEMDVPEIAAGLEVADVLRVLPALELSGQAVWTGTGWKLAEGARITRLVTP